MAAGLSTEILLALVDVAEVGVDGTEVQRRLHAHGIEPRADVLLAALLRLETANLLTVDRNGGLQFALTADGRHRAYELGGGQPVHVQLLMADLVAFTEFTSAHGDAAARSAAGALLRAASDAVRRVGGEVVKSMGDGLLAWVPPSTEPGPVLAELAGGCEQPSGQRWQLHAASHVGRPIRHRGDLFGRDVNLVARLCDAARPGELLRTAGGHGEPEHLRVRGFDEPVEVWREVIG